MHSRKIYFYIGTTAELIKLSPVIGELNKRKILFRVITSGQSEIHFEEMKSTLGNVDVCKSFPKKHDKSSVLFFIVWAIRTYLLSITQLRTEFRLLNKSNSYFIIHGDTVSSLIGSLVARFYGLKLVHIESGLRSFSFLEPFPEEICRYIISRLAQLHFCPNEWAMNNLQNSSGVKINTNQNTLIDVYSSSIRTKCKYPLTLQLIKKRVKYFVLVIHRQEHVIFGKEETRQLLKEIFATMPRSMTCVFLVHDLAEIFISSVIQEIPKSTVDRIIKLERLPYGEFMHLLRNSQFMITDGGSNQEELYYMGKPCLILRNRSERIEGLGENALLSYSDQRIIQEFFEIYKSYVRKPMKYKKSPSKIICDYLQTH